MKTIQSTVSTPDELYPFHQPLEQIAFFDIETTGLSPKTSSIYLIGVMHYNSHKQSWQITQWFADDYQSEEPILEAFLSYLEDFSASFTRALPILIPSSQNTFNVTGLKFEDWVIIIVGSSLVLWIREIWSLLKKI